MSYLARIRISVPEANFFLTFCVIGLVMARSWDLSDVLFILVVALLTTSGFAFLRPILNDTYGKKKDLGNDNKRMMMNRFWVVMAIVAGLLLAIVIIDLI